METTKAIEPLELKVDDKKYALTIGLKLGVIPIAIISRGDYRTFAQSVINCGASVEVFQIIDALKREPEKIPKVFEQNKITCFVDVIKKYNLNLRDEEEIRKLYSKELDNYYPIW